MILAKMMILRPTENLKNLGILFLLEDFPRWPGRQRQINLLVLASPSFLLAVTFGFKSRSEDCQCFLYQVAIILMTVPTVV